MGKHIKRERRPGLLGLVFMLWVILSVLAVRAWQKPLVQEETIKENPIAWTSSYDYAVEVNPCTLYPQAGVMRNEGTIFPAVTRKIIVDLETELSAEKPVLAQGTYQLFFQLTAEELWTRTFPLTGEKAFQVEGIKSNVIKEEVVLDLKVIKDYIAQVEAETKNSKRTYSFAVKPELTGILAYNEKTLPLQEDSALQFTYGSSEIKLAGEQNFSTDLSFKKKVKAPQYFVWAGKNYSLLGARSLFTGLSLLCLVLLIYQGWQQHLIKKNWRESQKIDKKYGSRLIHVTEKMNVTGKTRIRVKSFQSLLQIAEEKELPIFKFYFTDFKVIYFVPDGDYLYFYLVKEPLTLKQVAVRAEKEAGSRNVHG